MSSGVNLIAAERQRQLAVEGYTAQHDDDHTDSQLRWAAAAYLLTGQMEIDGSDFADRVWPWARAEFRPSPNQTRNLVKAGALIAAEVDRTLRTMGDEAPSPTVDHTHAWSGHASDVALTPAEAKRHVLRETVEALEKAKILGALSPGSDGDLNSIIREARRALGDHLVAMELGEGER